MEKRTFGQKLKNMGPAAIITSAFIGPGTITTATIAGVNFGYKLLWAVVFSVVALMVLMEMSSRIGILGNKDMVEASIDLVPGNRAWEIFIKVLLVIAVASVSFGFQAGNIIGSSLGLKEILGTSQLVAALIVGALSLSTVLFSTAKFLEKIMLIFVSTMGLIFLFAMIAVGPNIVEVFKGLVTPVIPEGGVVSTIALIGTTLIAINLVLHSITSKEKWNTKEDLENAKFDIVVNVLIGGVITVALIVTSATVLFNTGTEVTSPLIFSKQLEPVLGVVGAKWVGGLGIFAAGLSSSIATTFTISTIFSKVFKWENGVESKQAKIVGTIVVLFGTAFAIMNTRPVQIITTAQVMSGFFLPFISILLVLVCNNKRMLGENTNTLFQNILGVGASIITLILGTWGLYNVFISFF
ncbi:MAG: Nramp family divalent metal transporter [Erysipelothrix sp.]|nr:Nramp family divalent metal transporter [Erysipelothrix sp.]